MTRYLVLVESHTKTKLIKQYLEKNNPNDIFEVHACFGHVRDLTKDKLGIDLDTMKISYVMDVKKRDVIQKFRKLTKQSDIVLLATDNDREGESISWHLKEILRLKADTYRRMIFNEITETSIHSAFKNLKMIDIDLVHAQQARRIIDRIVGFKISPLLWKTFNFEKHGMATLSAGRVQSATLKYVIDRESTVERHTCGFHYTIKSEAIVYDYAMDMKLYNKKSDTIWKYERANDAKQFLQNLKGNWVITNNKLYESTISPNAPFITSTMQQEAATTLGFSIKQTMMLAQDLYERGLITYMRTDSYALSAKAIVDIKEYIIDTYGMDAFHFRDYAQIKKVKNGQEAHEAIRPTSMFKTTINGQKDQVALYELIWKRTIACQMNAANYLVLGISIEDEYMHKNANMEFRGELRVVNKPGYLLVWGDKCNVQSINRIHQLSKSINQTQNLQIKFNKIIAKQTFDVAPCRYNEASLIKALEHDGIGRPSTFVGILEKLYAKNYVVVQHIQGSKHTYTDYIWTGTRHNILERNYELTSKPEKGKLVPTDIGKSIYNYLERFFPDIIDHAFTSKMEIQLDEIANGMIKWEEMVKQFWSTLEPKVALAISQAPKPNTKTLLSLAHSSYTFDNGTFIVRLGKYGPLIEKEGSNMCIGLRPYLKLVKKSYTNLSKDEIHMLTSLPLTITTSAQLKYGRFGFYLQVHDLNYKLPTKWVQSELGGWQHLLKLNSSHVMTIMTMQKDYLGHK